MNKINIERTALIIGTILGVVAFFWQVYDSVDKQREKIRIQMAFNIPKEDLPIDLSIEVINYGQRPVYIKKIAIQNVISKSILGNPRATEPIVVFLEDRTQTDPIQPGQSREYIEQVSYDDIKNWITSTKPINLTVQSPTDLLFNQEIKKCLDDADIWVVYAKEVKDSNEPFLYSCNP